MSYQVLARKWRPASFDQVVGQSHVLHALTNALSQQRLHHAYLFTGTRGVGKTSLARLFAKGLNCEQGITATPCGKCASCVEIAQGRFVDLIEVDAASRTKVDDTRELLDNVQYRPTRGRFKVYLIDEVHMLSRSSFNALLKTLEEPPEHVKFLLATTDPQKLPITVLSRCLQFNLKSLSQQEIGTQLDHILTQEQVPNEATALQLLAKAANGSMRDALSLTDQAIAFGAGQVMLSQVQTMLGSVDERQVLALLDALVNGDIAALMTQADKVLAFGADADEVLRSLLELLHQITLAQFAPAAAQLSMYAEQINHFAASLAAEQVQLYYQLLLHGRKDLPFAPDPKSGLEMALLRAVAFEPKTTPNRWQGGEASPQGLGAPAVNQAAPQVIPSTSSAQSAQPPLATAADNNANAVAADAETNTTTDTAELDNSNDDVAALAAEQALIMSQADSMGYQPQQAAVQEDVTSQVVEAPQAVPQSTPKQYVTDDDDSSADEPFHDDLTGDMFGAPVAAAQDVTTSTQMIETATVQAELGQDAIAESEPANLTTPPLTSAATDEFSDANRAEAQGVVSHSDTTSHTESAPAASDDVLGDNLLDMVLASRDSLIKDIEELSAEEETSAVASLAAKKAGQEASGAIPEPKHTQSPPSAATNDAADIATTDAASNRAVATEYDDYASQPHYEAQPDYQTDYADYSHQHANVDDGRSAPFAVTNDTAVTQPAESIVQVAADAPSAAVVAQPAVNDVASATTDSALIPSGNSADLQWYKLVAQVNIGGRVRQLAANSVCYALGQELKLLLKPDQKHLAAKTAVAQMETAMSEALGVECHAVIEVGIDEQRETPREIRRRFNQELLAHAKTALIRDENVRWMMAQMGAQLDEDSLSYPAEMLAEKTAQIAS